MDRRGQPPHAHFVRAYGGGSALSSGSWDNAASRSLRSRLRRLSLVIHRDAEKVRLTLTSFAPTAAGGQLSGALPLRPPHAHFVRAYGGSPCSNLGLSCPAASRSLRSRLRRPVLLRAMRHLHDPPHAHFVRAYGGCTALRAPPAKERQPVPRAPWRRHQNCLPLGRTKQPAKPELQPSASAFSKRLSHYRTRERQRACFSNGGGKVVGGGGFRFVRRHRSKDEPESGASGEFHPPFTAP